MSSSLMEQQLGAFTADPAPDIRRLRESGTSLLLKDDSEGDVVIMPVDEYRRLRSVEDQWETIVAVKEGLADAAAGRSRPARQVLAELAAKYNLSDSPSD